MGRVQRDECIRTKAGRAGGERGKSSPLANRADGSFPHKRVAYFRCHSPRSHVKNVTMRASLAKRSITLISVISKK